ncbi:MAG: hypothetical protein OXU27_06810 [Candidatus Poribacteria bacterium]|nr:hypothetical protein [Candidatus Poribacteria bacterium]
MGTKQIQTNKFPKHPFPLKRPDVKIVESSDRITEVDCPELQWWFIVPQMGEPHFRAEYDANTLELDVMVEITPTTPATIRGIDCVELQVGEWLVPRDWPPGDAPDLIYATLDDTYTKWISVVDTIDGETVSSTIGDESFEEQWGGPLKRRIVDDGRYQLQADRSYKITGGQGFGAGTYDVTIGENTFHCLRVLDVDISDPHGGELAEVFVESSSGRTVFFRRYDGRYLRGHDLVAKYPNNRRIVINDVVYVHSDCSGWAHDQLTSFSLRPIS